MSICEKNITTNPYNDSFVLDNLQKNYGLKNIFNVQSNVLVCAEVFNGPTFNSNFTSLISGLTESSSGVFNFTNNQVDFSYTFTGFVSTLTAYTGEFQYRIYPRNIENPEIIVDQITGGTVQPDTFVNELTYSASTSFSVITNSGFTYTETLILPVKDEEYVFNSNYLFNPNSCLTDEVIVTNNLGNVYEDGYSLYFVTIVDPEEPILGPFPTPVPVSPETLTVTRKDDPENGQTYVFGVPQQTENSKFCQLITENLDINPVIPDKFTLSYKPFDNTVMVSVNGITLSPLDYTITDYVVLTLSQSLYVGKDLITVTYLACDKDLDYLKSENYQITGITSGVTSATTLVDKVYYNTDHNTHEYYTDYQIEDIDNILFFLNGIKLTYGVDFYQSVTRNNRLIFNPTIFNVSDIIHVIYTINGVTSGDYGTINRPGSLLEWKVSNPTNITSRIDGEFLVEITESNDPLFVSTATTQQIVVDYVNGQTLYNTPIPTTGITENKTYIWRVTNKKVYSGLLNNIFETERTSLVGKFITRKGINSY